MVWVIPLLLLIYSILVVSPGHHFTSFPSVSGEEGSIAVPPKDASLQLQPSRLGEGDGIARTGVSGRIRSLPLRFRDCHELIVS